MPGLGSQLPHIFGALNSLRGGSNAFAQRWRELEMEAQQRRDQEAQQARLTAQDDRAQQDLMLRADTATRQRDQEQRALVNDARTLLEDPTIDDPAAFDTRLHFVRQMVPSIDPGFLNTLRPAPTVFQQRQAKKKLAEIEKAYNPAQLLELENGAVFDLGGERLTIAQLRELAGTAALDPATGQARSVVPSAKPDVPNTPEEQFYATFARERGKGSFRELSTDLQTAAKAQWAESGRAPADPVLAELRQMRLEQARGSGASLPAPVQRRVDAKVKAFDAQPVVKRIQTMAEATQFAEGLDIQTKNPQDDQALIYAFAKAMDPDSVVREGEYATVQRYAQSWAERFGFDVARIFSNTVFLTPQARANMKTTIRARYQAARPQYDNLRRAYAEQINQITKGGDGDSYLIDYAAGFPTQPSRGGGGSTLPPGLQGLSERP